MIFLLKLLLFNSLFSSIFFFSLFEFIYTEEYPRKTKDKSKNHIQSKYSVSELIHIILNHPNPLQRRFASHYIKFHNPHDPKIRAALFKALEDYDKKVQEIAIRSLASLKIPKKNLKKISLRLIGFLNVKKSKKFKKLAMITLSKIRSPYAFYPIVQLLQEPDFEIQKYAIKSLIQYDNSKALRFIIPKLFHNDPAIRIYTILWIEKLKDPRTIKFLKKIYTNDPILKVRQVASLSLRKLGVNTILPR